MAIATISLGVQNRALNDELHDESSLVTNLAAQASRAQQVLEVLTAPSAQRVTLTEGKAPAQPTARATYLPERGGLILLATNLKPLPEGKTYELWVIPADGKAPVPAGLFHPDAVGHGHPGAAAACLRDCGQGLRGDHRECRAAPTRPRSDHSVGSRYRELKLWIQSRAPGSTSTWALKRRALQSLREYNSVGRSIVEEFITASTLDANMRAPRTDPFKTLHDGRAEGHLRRLLQRRASGVVA